jgi:hypothetical protein
VYGKRLLDVERKEMDLERRKNSISTRWADRAR